MHDCTLRRTTNSPPSDEVATAAAGLSARTEVIETLTERAAWFQAVKHEFLLPLEDLTEEERTTLWHRVTAGHATWQVRRMRARAQDAAAQCAGCEMLTRLARDGETRAVTGAGGLEAVTAAMRAHPLEEVQAAGRVVLELLESRGDHVDVIDVASPAQHPSTVTPKRQRQQPQPRVEWSSSAPDARSRTADQDVTVSVQQAALAGLLASALVVAVSIWLRRKRTV